MVLAAGLGAPELAQTVHAEVPLMYKPGTVNFVTQPAQKLLNHIIVTGAALALVQSMLSWGMPWHPCMRCSTSAAQARTVGARVALAGSMGSLSC